MKPSRVIALVAGAAFATASLAFFGSHTSASAATQSHVKVLTYNVKAAGTEPANHPLWTSRRASVVSIIQKDEADIVALQEVWTQSSPTDMETYLESALASNPSLPSFAYTEVNPAPTPYLNSNQNGNLIFYRPAKFNLIDKGLVSFQDYLPLDQYIGDCHVDADNLRWAILEDKVTFQRYFVANTHLANDWKHNDGSPADCTDLRTYEAHLVHKILVAHNPSQYPNILMGDFNADNDGTEPALPVLDEASTVSDPTSPHWYNLNSVVPLSDTSNATTTFNAGPWDTNRSNDYQRLDYIWAAKLFTVGANSVDTSKYSMGGYTLSPSDHYPLMAHLYYTS